MPPLIVVGLAWLCGMAWVALWGAPPWMPGLTIFLLIPAAAVGRLGLGGTVLVAAALAATAGAWRLETALDDPLPPLAAKVGEEVVLHGRVASIGDPGITTMRYTVKVHAIDDGASPVSTSGAVLVTTAQYIDWEPGTRLLLEGTLEEAPVFPDFDYRGYLARQGIVGTMLFPEVEVSAPAGYGRERLIASWRTGLEDELQRALPEPEAALAAGIALGLDGNISRDLYDDYRRSGLAHIVAVSGSNVALLTGIVFLCFVPLVGRNAAIAPAAAVVVAYVFIAGAEASIVRAGIMACVFLVGMSLGRQQSGLAALSAAAVLMTAVNPLAAIDIGFQLSLAATAGLLAFGTWIEWGILRVLPAALRPFTPRPIVMVAAWTVAATISTAPLIWLSFGELSTVGLVANLLVEPVFALALALSLLTAIAGAAWEPLGWLIGLAAWYPLALLNRVAETLGSWRWASVETTGATGTRAAIAYAVLLAIGAAAFLRPPPREGESDRATARVVQRYAAAAVLGLMVVAVWWFSLRPIGGTGAITIAFLDVGQGDAVLITTPSGRQVLVDGGPSGIELTRELGEAMPHWDRRIDHVVLSHPQQDHIAGLAEVARRFDVSSVADTGATSPIVAAQYYERSFETRTQLLRGDVLDIDGVSFEVLWPVSPGSGRDLNNASLVLAVSFGGSKVLLTGDIESQPQASLLELEPDLHADVLKVPHHGAATSSAAFLDAVGARLAVISVGAGNRFGHPASSTLEALGDTAVLRTDLHGTITVTIDAAGNLSYRTER